MKRSFAVNILSELHIALKFLDIIDTQSVAKRATNYRNSQNSQKFYITTGDLLVS